jgi:hypothetical protein
MKENNMKLTENSKMFIIGTFILVVGILLVVIGNSISTSESTILKNQVVDNLSFENASLEYNNGVSTFKVEVTNDNLDTYNLKYIEINFKDSNDNINKLIGYIGESIASSETKEIVAKVDKDITNSVSLEYVVVK